MRERVCMQCRGQFVTQVTTVAPKGLTIKAALRWKATGRAVSRVDCGGDATVRPWVLVHSSRSARPHPALRGRARVF